MLALAYSLSLLVIWTLIGRAVFAWCAPRFGVLRSWLLAPGVGVAVMSLAVMMLNQLGLPIARFSQILTAALVAAAVVGLWKTRPLLPRAYFIFVAAAVVSLLWTGWPALRFGFKWISYGNDDMANYCLAAQRFSDHGFFDPPTMADLSGRDYAAYYFFMHVADMMRFGAEHVVAWAATLARIPATQAFMPAIQALGLVQLFCAAGLALQAGRHRRLALTTAWLLAISPLFMLGTLYQLIAQVGGVALMLVTVALFTRSWGVVTRRPVIRYAILPALTTAALCIFYPETTPFAGVAIVGYFLVAILRRRLAPAIAVALVAYVLVGIVILLRYNLISYLSTLVMQLGSALSTANLLLSLFPYFLLPTGFSNLFGWMPISHDFAEPVVTLSIAGGMLLSVILLLRAVRDSWRLHVFALLFLTQAIVAIKFYRDGSDFNLYKLAMWMQPGLAAGLAGLLQGLRSRMLIAGAVAVFALSTAASGLHYTRASEGYGSGGMTELRFASQLGLHITPPRDPDAQITATIENVVAAKFAASELRGRQLALASRDYFFPNTRIDFRNPPLHAILHPHFKQMAQARPLMVERNEKQVVTSTLWRTEFSQPVLTHPTDDYLSLAWQLSLFNKFGHNLDEHPKELFALQPARAARNELVFVHSGRGNHYYLGNRNFISFFQQEIDPYAPSRDFNGLGRFLLLRVENPSDQIYLRIAATRTLLSGRTQWEQVKRDADGKPLPLVTEAGIANYPIANGAENLALGIVGGGAFNLFVGPLRPREFEGAHYVAIDFAEHADQIHDLRTGLKALYNRDISLDYRRVVGWARDISALSPTEYAHLKRPTRIAHFPEDFANAETLEFSGMYEDGWMSPESKFVLGHSDAASVVRVKGFVPNLPGSPLGTGTLRLTVGDRAFNVSAAAGDFDWLVPVSQPGDLTRIGLKFSVSAPLPAPDNRPAAACLRTLEVLPALPGRQFDYTTIGSPRPAASGIDQDGWTARQAAIALPASATASEVVLKIEFPDWGAKASSTLRVRVTGAGNVPPVETPLLPGQYATVRLHLPASANPRTIELEAASDFSLPAPDNRRRACRVLQLDLAPEA